jgi:hypothetical protein
MINPACNSRRKREAITLHLPLRADGPAGAEPVDKGVDYVNDILVTNRELSGSPLPTLDEPAA